MAKKKNFGLGGKPADPITPLPYAATPPGQAVPVLVSIPLPHGKVYEADFSEYLGQGFDDTVAAITLALRTMVSQGKPEPLSLETIVSSGLRYWFRFCLERSMSGYSLALQNIDEETIDAFCGWLGTRVKANGEVWSKNTARTVYQKVCTVLRELVERKLIPQDSLFRKNRFPGATNLLRRRNYIEPLSDGERERILRPLAQEVAAVFEGTHPGSLFTQLGLCIFAILLKTGLNPTPLLEIPRDLEVCFIDHPRINRKMLVTFKRRAKSDIPTPLEPSASRVVSLDVYRLCQHVVQLTETASKMAVGTSLEGFLWVYESEGAARGMSTQSLSSIASSFTAKHQLLRDDGTRLKMSSQLFRNTKFNRVWRASRGDLLATARSGSNTVQTAQRYLAVTPEMVDEHRIAGEVLVETLEGKFTREHTPHSGCKDVFNGELAPKDGSVCIDFLSCFRCKSQVVIQDDLYKLFSFYWAVFSQRSHIGHDRWVELFRWITRVIDRDIAPKFDRKIVEREKARARKEPHAMWRSPSVLAALRSIQ